MSNHCVFYAPPSLAPQLATSHRPMLPHAPTNTSLPSVPRHHPRPRRRTSNFGCRVCRGQKHEGRRRSLRLFSRKRCGWVCACHVCRASDDSGLFAFTYAHTQRHAQRHSNRPHTTVRSSCTCEGGSAAQSSTLHDSNTNTCLMIGHDTGEKNS